MDLHNSHIMVDGQFVSAKVEQVVLAIKEYEPTLEVRWIPPGQRSEGEAAFAIIHDAPGNKPYVLFYVPKEEDFDERVLARIIQNDQRNGQHRLSDFEAAEAAVKRVEHQKFLDSMEEAADISRHILKTKLNTYKVNDNLVIKDGVPGNHAARRN